MRTWLVGLLLLMALCVPAPGRAQQASPELRQRAEQLVRVLRGEEAPDRLFSPAFLSQIPAAQITALAEQLRRSYGPPTGIASIDAKGPLGGTVLVDFPRATARMDVALDPAAPHLVAELLIKPPEAKAETPAALLPAFRALPGRVSLAAAPLDVGPPHFTVEAEPEQALAVGSDFKLFILAELVREVKAGERRWSDVVPLSARSLPSGILQTWPAGAPITLHSLASLMISQSDNSAADQLLATLGRDKVERLLPALGVRAPARNRPFLSTREAFLLKGGDPARLGAWTSADQEGRRAILRALAGADAGTLDIHRFLGNPVAIDRVEWYASAADLVRTLDWIRRSGDRVALDILAINPGLPAGAGDYAYLGYKGGSESGVLAMAFLARRKDGAWVAAAAIWNDTAAPVDEARFAPLMSRLMTLLR
jgi:beta-lactamase class A